ncbi:MAG: hypothetical protein ACTSRA_12110 [Promethearchaeota archaeon]
MLVFYFSAGKDGMRSDIFSFFFVLRQWILSLTVSWRAIIHESRVQLTGNNFVV